MPKVLEIDGYKFYFWSEEGNEPSHIHVIKGSGEAKIWLEPEFRLQSYFGLKTKEIKKAVRLAFENKELLLNKWSEYFEGHRD